MQQHQNQDNDIIDETVLTEIQKEIESIQDNLKSCKIQSKASDKKAILFLGFRHNVFGEYYSHFERCVCLSENQNEQFKIVWIEKMDRQCYIINIPYGLKSIYDKEQKIQACSSKINLANILAEFIEYKFHIVINYDELRGNNEQDKLKNILDLEVMKVGKFTLREEKISLIGQPGANRVRLAYVKNPKSTSQPPFQEVQKNEILKNIFKLNEFQNLKISQNPILFSYGVMSCLMDDYKVKILKIINQKTNKLILQLYSLQQIPKLEQEFSLMDNLGQYLKLLSKCLAKYKIKAKLSDLCDILSLINDLTSNEGCQINRCLEQLNMLNLEEFLNLKKYTLNDLKFPQQFLRVLSIKTIADFFKDYYQYQYNDINFVQIQNLAINVEFWNKNYKFLLENKIFQTKRINELIQPEPLEEIEKGVYFFGKSRVGKSTILNLINNPQSLTVEKQIDCLCYTVKQEYNTNFIIEHGCMSETQKISSIQIDDIHYFDCPGFDDNLSEYARLAHRISLYNYLKKTKKVIGFMVLDGSIRDAQIIKDTIDPIYLLIKDKNQLLLENENWLSLILVKINQNTRVDYINNWGQAYQGLLDGRYSFYQTMYANDNQCVEFHKPQENFYNNNQAVEVVTDSIKTKITNIIQSQLQNNNFQVGFELFVEPRLFYLSEMSAFLLNIKIQQILDLFTNQFNDFIKEETKPISKKKESISALKLYIQEDINLQNVEEVLTRLKNWCNKTAEFINQTNYFSLLIEDVQSCIQSLKLFQNAQIAPIEISTQNLRQNMEKIIELITSIENWIKGFYIAAMAGSIIGALASCGAAFIGEEAIIALSAAALRKAMLTISIRTAITAGSGVAGSLPIGIILDVLQNKILQYLYDKYLQEQNRNK